MNLVVLVIAENAKNLHDLRQGLSEAKDGPFQTICATSLADAIEVLGDTKIDCILIDLDLPDSTGVATFDRIYEAAPSIPILTLSCTDDESAVIETVQRGAQGYLSQGFFKSRLVPQALRSIIIRKAVEEALFVEKERANAILKAIGDAVFVTALDGAVNYMNPVAERMTGWTAGDAQGRPFADVANIVERSSNAPVWQQMLSTVQEGKAVCGRSGLLLRWSEGREIAVDMSVTPVPAPNGGLSDIVIVLHDASAAEVAAYQKMTYLAEHDFLTDLPNRLLLNDRINQAIARAARNATEVAVLFLDLDNFKHVNDSLGHSIGDQLLQSVAQRLKACVRTSDTVSRPGGDEFIVVMADETQPEDAALSADKVLNELAAPHLVQGHQLQVTTSIGISLYPQDGKDADTLVKNADTAMYYAKNGGRNNYRFFNNEMNVRAVERQQTEAHLRHALKRGELVLFYQPKVDLQTGHVTGAEALLRWQHPQRGIILPDSFVGVAEDSGLIGSIGHWVLREACQQAKAWIDSGLPLGSIAVNVSASEFRSRGFLDGVRTVLENSGLDPHMLELELTETVLMRDADGSQSMLRDLKQLGVKLIVDDFGTGYSSLSYLKQFPIDVLKIDRSFVLNLKPESDNGIIVTAVAGMGRNLKLRVVAEGVETRDQCRFLRARKCDEGQGFYFSPPLPSEQFGKFLKEKRRMPR